MNNVKACYQYFKIGLIRHFAYRGTLVSEFFGRVISVIFIIFLWSKIYESKEQIAGMTFSSILVYYILAYAFRIFMRPNGSPVANQIKNGKMQIFLTRPHHPLMFHLGMGTAKRIAQGVLFLLVAVITLIIIMPRIGYRVGELHFLPFLPFLVLAYLLSFLQGFIIGMSAFWVTNAAPIIIGFGPLSGILGGLLVPLSFFPPTLQRIVMILPFRFLVSDPILVLQGKLQGPDLIRSLMVGGVWLIISYFMAIFIWSKGVRRFDAVGN